MSEETKRIINEMKEICDVWVIMDGLVKGYNQNEIHLIYEYIKQLQQENQQLKEKLEEKIYLSEQEILNKFFEEYPDGDKELTKYQSVLNEIREYINTKLRDVNLTYGIDNEFRREYDDMLQILDKVKE